MRAPLLLLMLLVAACAAPESAGVRPRPAGDSRDEGIVTMSSVGTLYNPVSPDWREAQAAADRRCRSWGYDGASSYDGWQEACRIYDFHGRCASNKVTRFYHCSGG